MLRRLFALAVIALVAIASAARASGSDFEEGAPMIDIFGGDGVDQARFFAGQPGVIAAGAPRARLFMAWRLLHGETIPPLAGEALAQRCCGAPDNDSMGAAGEWGLARRLVLGADTPYLWIERDRKLANVQYRLNCFAPAFTVATATLKARIAAHGAGDPGVRLWLDRQDGVFQACAGEGAELPGLAGAPGWLVKDGAYQAAARSLYLGDNLAAAQGFAAIARDPASPWQRQALYLTARSLLRDALERRTPVAEASARKVIDALAASPPGTWAYREEAASMRKTLDFRLHPAVRRAELETALARPLTPAAAADFRDYAQLTYGEPSPPEVIDWIFTLKAGSGDATEALVHARERWVATRDPAWLIAALSLTDQGDPAAGELVAAAARIDPLSPAGLSLAWQSARLDIQAAPPASMRARLETLLARRDLSTSDRNLFLALRLQVAESPAAFVRAGLQKRNCFTGGVCARLGYRNAGPGWHEAPVDFAPDALALIDRMTLADRMAVGADSSLTAEIRLDLALTNWTRAVLLQDNPAIDRLSRDLVRQMPLLAADWRAVAATAPGPDKRFAEVFILSKLPGLSPDLSGYTRPEGTLAQMQGSWQDWMLAARAPAADNPGPLGDPLSQAEPVDLICDGECGGWLAVRDPPFMQAARDQARRERGRYLRAGDEEKVPADATSVWEEDLAWIRAHPADARAPEALYWLVHVAKWGPRERHIGCRAWRVLHKAYGASVWAARTPRCYDL